MSWIIKDHYEDNYDFEMDRMALESSDIIAFSCPELLMIEVPVKENDVEKIGQIYEILFPGLFEDVMEMMNKDEQDRDPYKVSCFYRVRQSDLEEVATSPA